MGGWRCGYLRRSREGSDYTTINLYFVSHVFQSTLPRRERRPANGRFRCAPPHFNPRSREGSDATFPRPRLRRDTRFQSTLPRRERPRWQARSSSSFPFQSTLPRKERRKVFAYSIHSIDFNPRSREGSDPRYTGAHLPRKISIHAPVKGATCGSRYHCRRDTISIHIECQIGILGGDKQRVKQLFHSSIAPFR